MHTATHTPPGGHTQLHTEVHTGVHTPRLWLVQASLAPQQPRPPWLLAVPHLPSAICRISIATEQHAVPHTPSQSGAQQSQSGAMSAAQTSHPLIATAARAQRSPHSITHERKDPRTTPRTSTPRPSQHPSAATEPATPPTTLHPPPSHTDQATAQSTRDSSSIHSNPSTAIQAMAMPRKHSFVRPRST